MVAPRQVPAISRLSAPRRSLARVAELNVKGTAFRQVLDTYREVEGEAFHAEVIAKIPGPGGEAIRTGTLLASAWQPMAWYRALLHTGSELRSGLPFALAIGRRSAERDIGTVHRMIFRVISVETMVKQIPRILGLYFDGGRGVMESAIVETNERGTFKVAFSEFWGFDEYVWMDFVGGCEAMLAATGKKNARARIVRGGRADDALIELSYRP